MFLERGAPAEILTDNDIVFRGRRLASFVARWGITLRFRAVHEPVPEAVHLYITFRDGRTAETAPAAGIHRYAVRDCVRPARA